MGEITSHPCPELYRSRFWLSSARISPQLNNSLTSVPPNASIWRRDHTYNLPTNGAINYCMQNWESSYLNGKYLGFPRWTLCHRLKDLNIENIQTKVKPSPQYISYLRPHGYKILPRERGCSVFPSILKFGLWHPIIHQ